MLDIEELKKQILQHISEEELDKKVNEKITALNGLISAEGACSIIANELGVKPGSCQKALKVKDIVPGMRSVAITCKIVRKYDLREFTSQRGPGKVGSILVGDETGQTRIVFWNDQTDLHAKVNEGDILQIQGLVVRERTGNFAGLELHAGHGTEMSLNPEGVEIAINAASHGTASRKHIAEISGDEENIELLATITQVFDLRFFASCPDCNKRLVQREGKETCLEHGEVEPSYGCVLNLVLDDGTSTIRCAVWRRQLEALLNQGSQDILQFKNHPELFEGIKTELLGEIVKVIGRSKKNEMFDRLEFHAQMVFKNPDPAGELKQ